MFRGVTALTVVLGLCWSAACAQTAAPTPDTSSANGEASNYGLLSITSPRLGQDLSGAKEVRIVWESLLGDGVDYSVVFSRDGKMFDREIASKLVDSEYTLKPDDLPLAGWVKVKAFRDGYLYAESVVPVSFVPPTGIVVSKADQKVFHFSGGKLRNVFTCSTALPGYDLKAGSYRIYLKQKKHWSKKWEVWMPHSMFFHAGYALHATTVIRRLGRPASHGCIRLHPRDAEKLYAEVAVGTPVIVLPKSKSCAHLESLFRPDRPTSGPATAASTK
ncbi:MAG: L,D-transpeptidase [Armatimonadota bacterium]